mmetsp:Transcript_19727/g.37098  ORF Transcript_19727/g.37098 Transcript_19727/m.37098 type:complete len:314 (-) Transcript_19727:38-979(-)
MAPLQATVGCRMIREPLENDLVAGASCTQRDTFARVPCADEAIRVTKEGLARSVAFNRSVRFAANGGTRPEDRAILAQSQGNLEELRKAGLNLREPLGALKPGCFGENLFLDSLEMTANSLCVGDELVCWRGEKQQPLRLQVASPRLPCNKVDRMHGKTFTEGGVRPYCARTGLAGFFLRTLEEGDLKQGDVLKLEARPNPDWTLARVAGLLYGNREVAMQYSMRGAAAVKDGLTPVVRREEFMGTAAELEELHSLPELAVFEWKEHVNQMLGKAPLGRYRSRSTFPWKTAVAVGIGLGAVALALAVRPRRSS